MNETEIKLLFKKAREFRQYTQKNIADHLNYSSQTISLWESGKVDPKLDLVCAFTNFLKISYPDFLQGNIIDSPITYVFDNQDLMTKMNAFFQQKNVNKKTLEHVMGVSRPTLSKILTGEIVLSFHQFNRLNEHFRFNMGRLFKEGECVESIPTHKKNKKASEHKPKTVMITSAVAGVVLLASTCISLPFVLKKRIPTQGKDPATLSSRHNTTTTVSTSTYPTTSDPTPIEQKPEVTPYITIDYFERKLLGFTPGRKYLVNGDFYGPTGNSIDIDPAWYEEYDPDYEPNAQPIRIQALPRDDGYSDGDIKTIYINRYRFENYFNDKGLQGIFEDPLSDKEIKENWETALKYPSNNLTDSDFIDYSDTMKMTLPYLSDDVFDTTLCPVDKDSYKKLDYTVDEATGSVTINKVKEAYGNSIESIYIPSSIDGIDNIRIAAEAFKVNGSFNKQLTKIVFEQKPHYIGNEAFSGLNLDVLDFGAVDDLSYSMDCEWKILPKDASYPKYYCEVFKGLHHVDKARLPAKAGPKGSTCFRQMFRYDETLIPKNLLNSEYSGINALVLPRIKGSDSETVIYESSVTDNYINGQMFQGMKIHSVYVPKYIFFSPFYRNFNNQYFDCHLRFIKYEQGYRMCKDEKYDAFNSISFNGCAALQYILRDYDPNLSLGGINLNGAVSLRGVIPFEQIDKNSVASNTYQCTRLPKKITLKNIDRVDGYAFKDSINLEEIDFYAPEDSDVLNINTEALDCPSLKKVTFHGYKKENIKFRIKNEEYLKNIQFVYLDQ